MKYAHSGSGDTELKMDEEDVRAKITRLAAEDQRGQEMMLKARSDCLSALGSMHAAMMALRNAVPETNLLGPPLLHEAPTTYRRDRDLDDEFIWHFHSEDCEGAPCIWTGLDSHIVTYNPIRDTWRCSSYLHNPPDMTRREMLDHYTDHLARWVVDTCPRLLREREEEEALAAARHAAEAERLAAKQAQEDSANTLAWMVGGLLILFTLIVIF